MFADRDLEGQMNRLSEASTDDKCTFAGVVLNIDLDGMDQSKFKVPRNMTNSNSLKDVWRPTVHVVGIIILGLIEAYV